MSYLEHYQDKTVLVTGGAGAIGSNLSRRLANLGSHVVILDDLSSGQEWNVPSLDNILFVNGNILNEIDLKRVFLERPQVVFHLAAFFANQNSVDYPERDLMTNGMGTLRLLEYSTNVERFVFASSGGSIYGIDSPSPLHEKHTSMRLSTPYQITKMLGELYCNFYHKHYGLKTTKVRIFNSYGPGEVPGQYRNVIPNFIYWAMRNLPLPVIGTDETSRDFTYVEDIVDGMLRAGFFEAAIGEAFNLATGNETRILDLAHKINDLAGSSAGVQFAPSRKWDTIRRVASITKASLHLGYEPKVLLDQGLAKTINWFTKNWDNIEASAQFGPGISSAIRTMKVPP